MRDSNSTMLIFISYIVFEFLILGWIIQKLYKQYGFKIGVLMTLLIVVSYPFMFSATRHGNNVALAAILCLTAVVLGESDSKVEQEIGLILIAVAAGLKFYPAILGLIYVKKRDWKKVIRLVIYGIVIVIGPFAFFGGIKGITALVGYLTGLSERVAEINTYEGFFTWGLSKVGIPESVGGMAANLMLVVMIVCFFLAKKRWQEMLFLGSVMTSYISSSKDYNCVYYLVAFILFLEEEELLSEAKLAHNGWVLFNLLIFTMLFTVPFYLSAVFYNMVTGVYLILFAHLFVNVAQVLISGFSKKKTITEEAN